MPAHEPTPPAAQGAFRPRLVPHENAEVEALHVELDHQRMVESALRTQYAQLKESFEALMDTHRMQFDELVRTRDRLADQDVLQTETSELQATLEALRASEAEATLRLLDAESRVIATERDRIAERSQHLKERNARSQAALERVRELNDLRGDLEVARREARRLQRELLASEAAERALEAYCDRLEGDRSAHTPNSGRTSACD